MAPNTQLACVGAHHQNLCQVCPPSTPAQTFVPHICLASLAATTRASTAGQQQPSQSQSQSQFCMCMCVGPDEAALPPQSINSVYSQPQTYSNPYNPYSQYQSPYSQSQYNPFYGGSFGSYY